MREYSTIEQERILRATASDETPKARSRATHSAAAEGKSDTSSEMKQMDELAPRLEETKPLDVELVQLMVDLESESKFMALLRRIQRRMSWF
jgi:hypothetical protein